MAKVFGYVSDVRYKWTLRLNSTLNKLEGVGTMRFEGKGSAFGFSSARKVNEKVGQRVDEQVKAQIINAIKPAVEDFEAAYNAPAED